MSAVFRLCQWVGMKAGAQVSDEISQEAWDKISSLMLDDEVNGQALMIVPYTSHLHTKDAVFRFLIAYSVPFKYCKLLNCKC